MTLKEKINSDYISALKSKDLVAKNLLSVVRGEIQTQEKNIVVDSLSDVDIVKILIRISKGVKETIESTKHLEKISILKYEESILEKYLPTQMSREEILLKIDSLISSGVTSIGDIMREFSSTSADKKIVSEIARSNKIDNNAIDEDKHMQCEY